MLDQPTFGDLLREHRIRSGLSQSDLAEKARISPAAVSALERGIRRAPYQSTISLLAKALNLTPEESDTLKGARLAGRGKTSKSVVSHNLEAKRTSFVGRDADIADIIKLLDRSRLVTITGSGGVGKTRVAIEAATQLLLRSSNETWFIDLAPLHDGELVPSKIAYTIQPALSERAGSIRALAVALANRSMFLIFDNCEHVIADAAQAADTILSLCPHVTILATSRERLNVAGEFVYSLPPLLLPPDTPDRIDNAQKYSAIDLFMQRAHAVAPRITFDSRDLPAIVEIVRRLDGIPLAIELAAAQVSILGLETLRDRLHQDFSVPSGRRDLPARQQTVNDTIRWSFELLTSQEQELLCDAAVFAGGFTLDAAEVICPGDPDTAPSVLQRLSSLVNKSLVNAESQEGEARYTLLESVRTFGLERLQEADRFTTVARRHAQWLARRADEYRDVEMSLEVAGELLPEIDNMRSAIAWSLNAPSQDDRRYGGHIISGFDRVWGYIGRPREFRQLLDLALERIDESCDPRIVGRLLCDFIIRAGREPAALKVVDRATRLCEQFGDAIDLAHLYIMLTSALSGHGMLDDAERSAERASEVLIENRLQDSSLHVSLLLNRHELRMTQERFDDAREDLDAAYAQALAHGEQFLVVCHCYSRYSTLEYAIGNRSSALEFAERMLASEFRANPFVALGGLERIAMLLLDSGDLNGAAKPLKEWILLRPIEEFPSLGPVEIAALYSALQGRGKDAAKLLGCVQTVEQRTHFRRTRMRADAYRHLCTLLQEQLTPKDLASALAEGALLTPAQARAEALAALE